MHCGLVRAEDGVPGAQSLGVLRGVLLLELLFSNQDDWRILDLVKLR